MGYQKDTTDNGNSASGGESDKYAGVGIGITGLLAENIISHPFIILRRQCQVCVSYENLRTHRKIEIARDLKMILLSTITLLK